MDRFDVNEFYRGLDIVLRQKNTVESRRFLTSSLEEAEKKDDIAGITAVCNELGGFYRVTGEFDKAEEVYNRVLVLLRTMKMSDGENYAVALINYGNVFIGQKEFKKAIPIYEEAVVILERTGNDRDYRMAALCNNISSVYREIGNLEKSEAMALKSLDIVENLSEAAAEHATTLVTLGQLYMRQGRFDEAERTLANAIDMFENRVGDGDPHFSVAMVAMGELAFSMGRYVEAEDHYKRALKLMERDFGRTPYYDRVVESLKVVREKIK